MRLLCVLAVCVTACGVGGELLNALDSLTHSASFQVLPSGARVYVTEIVAAAESCKLTAFLQRLGRERVTRLLASLPSQEAGRLQGYISESFVRGAVQAARGCQLTAFLQRVGRAGLTRLIAALPAEDATRFTSFISTRLAAEADGTCN